MEGYPSVSLDSDDENTVVCTQFSHDEDSTTPSQSAAFITLDVVDGTAVFASKDLVTNEHVSAEEQVITMCVY